MLQRGPKAAEGRAYSTPPGDCRRETGPPALVYSQVVCGHNPQGHRSARAVGHRAPGRRFSVQPHSGGPHRHRGGVCVCGGRGQ